jgi:valyl-tRNA synthetase
VEALREVVTRVRNFRSERGASPTAPVDLSIDPNSPGGALVPSLQTLTPLLRHLGRLSDLRFAAPAPAAFQDVVAGLGLGIGLPEGAAAESGLRVDRALKEIAAEIDQLSSKLQNPSFLGKAPAPVVEKARRRLFELEEKRAALAVSRS